MLECLFDVALESLTDSRAVQLVRKAVLGVFE